MEAVSSTVHMSMFTEMGNMVMFGPKIVSSAVIEWCSIKCKGAVLLIRHPMTLIVGPRQNTVGAFAIQHTKVEINTAGFTLVFEQPEDILLLKMTFDWSEAPKEFVRA